MSMQERPDDEKPFEGLDRLFRKSAEEYESPYDPAAWQLMQAKLDEHDRVVFWGRLLRWGLAIMLLLVFVSGGWYSYRQNRAETNQLSTILTQRTDPSVPTEVSEAQRRETAGPPPQQTRTNQKADAADAQQSMRQPSTVERAGENAVGRTDKKLTGTEATATGRLTKVIGERRNDENAVNPETISKLPNPVNASPTGSGRRIRSELAGRQSSNQPMQTEASQRRRLRWPVVRHPSPTPNREFIAKSNGFGADGVLNTKQSILPSTNEMTATGLSDSASQVSSELYRIGTVDAMSSRGRMQWPIWAALTAPALPQPAPQPTAEQSVKPPRERGIQVRVGISPDISSVGLNNFTKPGKQGSLFVEYRFSRRWSVQVGVGQSKKIYKALPDEYTYPANWGKPPAWRWIDGTCTMLDVPINLRYDVALKPVSKGQSRLFVSGGVTSYVIKKQDYVYKFENPYAPNIHYRGTSVDTPVRSNLSHLNLSVGYERPLTKRLAWQIEPYAKIPLKSVGFFKVNLLSTGALVSLRYKLN